MIAMFMVLAGALLRLVPHAPNFTPLGAIALFATSHIPHRYSFLVAFGALLISDYLLLYINPYQTPMVNFSQFHPVTEMFHSTTFFVWLSFFIYGYIGRRLGENRKPLWVVSASLLGSVQFFLITNFGVWAGGYYGSSISGLWESYLMAIPFFRGTLLGDLSFTVLFLVLYALALRVRTRHASL